MRDTNRNDALRCLAPDELVTYVYDECDAGERAAIEAHVAMCAICAEELASLRATRTTLAGWAPPETALGFRISRPTVLTSPRWWSRPLPAWAQAAAAVVIFASGVAIGVGQRHAPVTTPPAVAVSAPAAAPVAAVSPQDLDAVAQQLRSEIAQARTVPAAAPARSGNDDVLRQVRALIADSEQRQQRSFALQTSQIVRQIDAQRRVDLVEMQRTVGQIQTMTGAAVRDQNQLVNYLMNVSQRR